MSGANKIALMFYTHEVVWHQQGGRTAVGTAPDVDRKVQASINTEAIPVQDENGTEIVASATICWMPDVGVPKVGDHITLPAKFGIKPRRKVIAARLADTMLPLLPNHVEVRVK